MKTIAFSSSVMEHSGRAAGQFRASVMSAACNTASRRLEGENQYQHRDNTGMQLEKIAHIHIS